VTFENSSSDLGDVDLDAVDEDVLAEDVASNNEDDLGGDQLTALSGPEADAPADAGRPADAPEVDA
jgi:hypothetical protein